MRGLADVWQKAGLVGIGRHFSSYSSTYALSRKGLVGIGRHFNS